MQCPECETGKLYIHRTVTDNANMRVYRERLCDTCGISLCTVELETADADMLLRQASNDRTIAHLHNSVNHNHKHKEGT